MIEPGLSGLQNETYTRIDKKQTAKPGPWDCFHFVLLSTAGLLLGVEFCIRLAHRVSPLRLVDQWEKLDPMQHSNHCFNSFFPLLLFCLDCLGTWEWSFGCKPGRRTRIQLDCTFGLPATHQKKYTGLYHSLVKFR